MVKSCIFAFADVCNRKRSEMLRTGKIQSMYGFHNAADVYLPTNLDERRKDAFAKLYTEKDDLSVEYVRAARDVIKVNATDQKNNQYTYTVFMNRNTAVFIT